MASWRILTSIHGTSMGELEPPKSAYFSNARLVAPQDVNKQEHRRIQYVWSHIGLPHLEYSFGQP